ncbi:glycerol-3-phosphate dehydrogenase/oxidase [Duganella callida]|uniref:Glycerol-3-phosphate dehydrogenase/oxidase n=1 Tax=Duganella callida TaxID=2561932 RepID=A0A4Y9S5C7_9BURK|nr:glycerol-3-phosphate dehydrogenase/oxidase [Duganella callida]TFW16389.1 glycerol-3-phosphate dehydrogenase/oxidase [Duganella callida]
MSRRADLAALLAREWDVLVIGGGITGAGILLEAARRGLKTLLVEQRDFAWGTSSRSSKLVHGGLRYLKEGRLGLTRESVHEREHLLRQATGLVEPQSFAFGDYAGRKPGRRSFLFGLAIYDRMAGQQARHYYSREEFAALAPNVAMDGLQGGMVYTDAKTDDARLVLRVLQEARRHGGVALNYMAVESLLRAGDSADVGGATLRDSLTGEKHGAAARLVINATGVWADRLRASGSMAGASAGRVTSESVAGGSHAPAAAGIVPRLRPLRGSHLVLPAWRLPLAQAISLMHPLDGRPVFAYPWEGVTLVGTTDVDHRADLSLEAAITRAEFDYLMGALHAQFPQLHLDEDDVISTYAGVRPVIDSGKADPSKAGREHALWLEDGMLTVTGGKLTTFRVIALDALKLAAARLPQLQGQLAPRPVFASAPPLRYTAALPSGQAQRLQGRYGAQAQALVDAAQPGELACIPGTETIWAQLRWAARHEDVCRLEDLLLRRSRIGLQLRGGGVAILPRVRAICQPELGWSDPQWQAEERAYLALWQRHYSLPRQ